MSRSSFGLLTLEGYPDVVKDVCARLVAVGLSFVQPDDDLYSVRLSLRRVSSSEYSVAVVHSCTTSSPASAASLDVGASVSPYVWLWNELALRLPAGDYQLLRDEYKRRKVVSTQELRKRGKG